MNSCLGILMIFTILVAVVGGGALLWYLSDNAEFARVQPTATAPALPPGN